MKQYKSLYHAMYKKYVAERLFYLTENEVMYKKRIHIKRRSHLNLFNKRNHRC